jgi:hypothetical protein
MWTIDMESFTNKFVEKAETCIRKIGLEVFSRVILRTPVKTGRARGNWQATLGTPAAGALETTDENGTVAIANASGMVSRWKAGEGAMLLTNNLPYIQRLENGWSKQHPNGMVGITVAEFDGLAVKFAGEGA